MAVQLADIDTSTVEDHSRIVMQTLAALRVGVPFLTDEMHDPLYDPYAEDRFTLENWGGPDTYLLSDKHNYDSYIIYYEQMSTANFDAVEWLTDLKLRNYRDLVFKGSSFFPTWNGQWVTEPHSGDSSSPKCEESSLRPVNQPPPSLPCSLLSENELDDTPLLLSCESSSDEDETTHLDPGLSETPAVSDKNGEVAPSPVDAPAQSTVEDLVNNMSEIFCGGTRTELPDVRSLHRNAVRPKSAVRILPRALVVIVMINGRPCRALLDCGSLTDFLSTTLVDQLKIKYDVLDRPIPLQLAVSGSRSVVKAGATVEFQYQEISGPRSFDIANIETYDVILGMPFLYQHQVLLGFNPSKIKIRSIDPLPIRGAQTQVLELKGSSPDNDIIERYRTELLEYARDICKSASETPLPPLRAINHVIPLVDDSQVYAWRQSKCPEALRPLWRAKRDDYVKTGRWEFFSGTNAVPMIMMKKATKDGSLKLRTVLDTRQHNRNTRKLASPLPDIETILRNVASHPYRSLLDGKDAYEQIRVVPEDVPKTLFATPDGTMISYVMQIGDCNAGATYQSLMNHIFGPYIGTFMDVYLDDIVIYSDSTESHVKHVKLVIDTLRENNFYLGADKLQFFKAELNILGHIIDDAGIRLDPHKVDKIVNWKTPTSKELLMQFIGSVGYLAAGCEGVQVDMQHLSKVAALTTRWSWSPTDQRAFDLVKACVETHRNVSRKAIDLPSAINGSQPVNLTTDASLTGASGVLSQGADQKTAAIVAFWSGKFNSAQQNYPVHEQELLAIVESLKRFRHLLIGFRFRIFTDHKGLEWITSQTKLSPRQTRWLEALSEFDFEITYLPGTDNVLADALSRMYCNEPKGTVRSASEYVSAEEEDSPRGLLLNFVSAPVYTGTPLFLGATEARRSARIATRRVLASDVPLPSDKLGTVPTRVSTSTHTLPLRPNKDLPSSPPTSHRLTRTRWRPASIDRDITSHSRSTPTLKSGVQEPGIESGLASPPMAPRLPPKATVK